MNDVNRIEIIRTAKGYNAKFTGPHAARVQELFNTSVIPLPFTVAANAADVVASVQSRHTDAHVYFVAGN